jgi:two-component system sensor histidine kinase QseC
MIQTAKMLTVPMDYVNFLEPHFNISENNPGSEYDMHYVVWTEEMTILLTDPTANILPSSNMTSGFHKIAAYGKEYNLYTFFNPKTKLNASAGYPTSINKKIIIDIIEKFWLSWLLGLFSIGTVNLICIKLGLKPIYKLGEEIGSRDPDNLNTFKTEVPFELKNFKEELNRMIERIKKEIEKERRFTADAAHELKTPLAAIKVQTEILSMDIENESLKKQVDKIISGVDRMNHTVEQMLVLSRLDDDPEIKKTRTKINFHGIFTSLSQEFSSERLKLDFQSDFILHGDSFFMEVLLKNLIENSVKYSDSGVEITLGVNENEFFVQDTGPGISSDLLQRVRERFFRPCGQKKTGSGLGLSIVEKIAQLHGLEMKLYSEPGAGLKASFSIMKSSYGLS